MKKLLSVLIIITMLIAFSSCKNKKVDIIETTQQQLTQSTEHSTSQQLSHSTESSVTHSTETTVYTSSDYIKATTSSDKSEVSTTNTSTTTDKTDPSEWSAEEVVEFYKTAAAKSQSRTKSVKKMTLKELTVNDGDGALGGFIDFCMPFFISALEKTPQSLTE